MKKGFRHFEESKRKMSIAHQGQKRSEWMKSRMRKPHLSRRGIKPKNFDTLHTPEINKKRGLVMSRVLKGHSVSEETRKKISKANIGKIAWNKGKNSPQTSGNKNGNWKDGRSKQQGYDGFLSSRRRIRKLENGGSHTLGEWENLKVQYNFICPSCYKSEPKIKLTEDHIIPLKKGGSDNIENIQPLCRSCNSRKQTKMIKFSIEN